MEVNNKPKGNMKAEDTDAVIALFDRASAVAEGEANYGTEAAQDASNAAFDAATAAGWNWEKDQPFVDWCLKATDLEVLAEGKKRFLKHQEVAA